jgi:hypothetical protein
LEDAIRREDEQFIKDATTELADLMDEVENAERRHGPKPRTVEQDRNLLEARLGALEQEHADVCAALDELHRHEEEPEPDTTTKREDGARFLHGARKELSMLVR